MMTRYFFLTTILLSVFNLVVGQKAPSPPLPPSLPQSISAPKIIEAPYAEEVDEEKIAMPVFPVMDKEFLNSSSIYFHKNIESLFSNLDTAITAEQVISLTKFNILSRNVNPRLLDSLSKKAYKENEMKAYAEAIKTCKQILSICPNNISGHKEIALAYKRNGQLELSDTHFILMRKIMEGVRKYGNGKYDSPYILNNFFEGISIYEAAIGCYPSRVTLMRDKRNRLLGAYNCHHIVNYADLTHWLPDLKEGDYIEEK